VKMTLELGDLLTNEQTASLLGVKPNTLEIWRCKGKGPPFVKLGQHPASPVRYQRSQVIAWLASLTFSSTSAATIHTAQIARSGGVVCHD
jgi:Helix-turn-helix domain